MRAAQKWVAKSGSPGPGNGEAVRKHPNESEAGEEEIEYHDERVVVRVGIESECGLKKTIRGGHEQLGGFRQ